MYHRILVPTDGSDGSQIAAEHAVDLATKYNASLHTVYAVETIVSPEGGYAGALDALEAVGQEAIADVVERAESGGIEPVEGSVVSGTPHRVILDYIDEHNIDLVVMGTHGRTGIERYLLGSVTQKVVRLSPVPVLTVRNEEE